MKIRTEQMLKILYVLSWIIFVGICIEAGSFIVNAFFALVNPAVVEHLWHEVDLSNLYQYDHGQFFCRDNDDQHCCCDESLGILPDYKNFTREKTKYGSAFQQSGGAFYFTNILFGVSDRFVFLVGR